MRNDSLSSIMDRMFTLSRALEQSADPSNSAWTGRSQLWMPPVDVFETDHSYVIELDVPGVHAENVDISFEQNTLTIKGERAPTLRRPEKGELRVYTAERVAGAFARSVRLPDYVEGDKIEASYQDGVLTISVPKAAAAKPRKISIRANTESTQKQVSA